MSQDSTIAHPIKIAAQRSGLTTHIIRAWEKRYGAVSPDRTGTHRRLYSESEIDRLTLLGRATHAGYSIGNIVNLSDEQLRVLAASSKDDTQGGEAQLEDHSPAQLAATLEAAYAAVAALDAAGLERELHRGLVAHGRIAIMQQVLYPLIVRIGESWEHGTLRIAHEHIASAVIRTFLGNFVRPHSETLNAPVLLVTTPSGQIHELGALLAAATAADQGWRVSYLGPNLPPEEIAGAFAQNAADAVAISIVYPADDPGLVGQMQMLRRLLPQGAPIIAGGRAAVHYRNGLDEVGAVICSGISEFAAELKRIRRRRVVGSQAS